MNSKFFSLFLVTILGFSAFSVPDNGLGLSQNAQFSINLAEELAVSSGFGQKIGNTHKILLNEQLEISNHDKYQKLISATKQLNERHAIMDRIIPNSRLRIAQDDDLANNPNEISMTDFIEIITDTFYVGGAKTPSMPSIPLAFAVNMNLDSIQLLQVNEAHGDELESVYSDTDPPWLIPNNQKSSSLISLENTVNHLQITQLNDFSSNISYSELNFTHAIIVVSAPGIIYIILFSEGLVPGIRPPKIPQHVGFYFLFIFFVFTSFSTPFATGNSMWGNAFGNMDNSTSTNSTQFDNPENIQFSNMTQVNDLEILFQNTTVTETDNVADGPKHYSVSISEGLIIGDGSPTNDQPQNEPTLEESSETIQISESVSFSDELGNKELPENENISESLSILDQLDVHADIIPDDVIRLNETISLEVNLDGTFGIGLIKISEFITFDEKISTEFHSPLNALMNVAEHIEFSSQLSINGVIELQFYENLSISEFIGIYTPIIRIEESLQLFDDENNQFTEISLSKIPVTNLIPQNTTLMLNGTSYLETDQNIAEFYNQFTISSWIKPQFNSAIPQMAALSKDLTFQILINNVAEPQHSPIFTIYDGISWHEVSGINQLEEDRWYHIAGVLDGSTITVFVDGIQQNTVSIPELFLVNEQGWLTETRMGVSFSENSIVIGGERDQHSDGVISGFSGEISGVLIHNKALDAEMINKVLQNTAPYSTTKIILSETVQISDSQGLSGGGAVIINESISFPELLDTGMIIVPRISSERIDLLALNGTFTNSTIALNGTGFVSVEDTISPKMNSMSISSWIKPDFNVGNHQFTITSKENSFNLFVTNVAEPPYTAGFSVFDGIKWNQLSGQKVLDEKWHHVMASVNGSKIALYVDGNLEDEKTIQNEFSIGNNGQYTIKDSKISVSESNIIIGAYLSTVREEIKTSDKFIGKIASVDVYADVLNSEQIAYKFQTELSELFQTVSLYETVQINDQANLLYEFTEKKGLYQIRLEESLTVKETISITDSDNTIHLNELLLLQENIIIGIDGIDTSNVSLIEFVTFDDKIIAINPFVPSVNPEIQMVKSGFLITENPKFELEYYSEDEAVKIDRNEILSATSIANKVQQDLATAPGELLTNLDNNSVTTAIQVIETRSAILELEEQVEQTPENAKLEDIKELQKQVEAVTESIENTAKRLEETHLEKKAEEIEKSAETIREAADIIQNANQTGIWYETDENISTRIISSDGNIFADEAFFEKEREGKFDVEILSDVVAKPGIYTVESIITIDQTEYTINEEFAWGLVSLNTKKSTYYPGETAEFEIVVLDSVGSPVCDANLVMSINGTTLSSGAGISPNAECGIYDAKYETGIEGKYHVEISAIAKGIQTGFETTFDVANFVEFDIIRTAQSKIDPVNNSNEFEVIIDVTSYTDATDIQIVESVPSVFGILSDGIVSESANEKTITWNKILQGNTTQIGYKYSVPMIFPELYPLGEVVINYDNKTFTESRPWFVANDPDIGSGWSSKVLRINSTLISGSGAAVTNVPILVKLTDDPDLSTTSVGSSGQGIRFTSDGSNLIDFEIETYSGDSDSGSIEAWVEVPTLSASVDTNLWIHYGKTTALSDAAQTADDVWEAKGYVVVNHLDHDLDTNNNTKELQGSVIGVDFNSNKMTNAVNQVTGQIGKAVDLNQGTTKNERVCLEVSGNLDCGGSGEIFDTAVSIRTSSLWYKADTVASSENRQMIFEEGGSTNGQNIYIYDGRIYGCTLRSNDAECGSTATTAGEWHHVALMWESSDTSYLYHDGERVATFTGKQNANHGNPSALGNIAGSTRALQTDGTGDEQLNYSNGAYDFPGIIDEFRVTNTGLSADLISNMYNSEKYPTNFVRDGIYLSETLSVTASSDTLYIEKGSVTLGLTETLSFTDSAATTSDADVGTAWNKKVLSTNSTLVSGSSNMSNVPILVKLTNDPDLSPANVGSDGKGIRFTSDGSTIINYEIEHYESPTATTGSVTAWVEIPTLDYNDNTNFYIHYGQPELSSTKYGSGVWDGDRDSGTSGTQKYAVVNHLHSTPDGNNDDREIKGSATSTNVDDYNSMNMNGESPVTGKTGLALDFNGSDEYICLADGNDGDGLNCSGGDSSSVFDGNPIIPNRSVSLWYNADVVNDNIYGDVLYEEGGATNGQNIYLKDSKLYAGSWSATASEKVWMDTPTTANEWHHVVFVMREGTSANLAELWHDGVKVKTSTGHNALAHSNDDCLGKNCSQTEIVGDDTVNETEASPNSEMMFDGTIDEFRVINMKLPDEFIITTYHSENDPGNFVCEGICLTESVSLSDSTSNQGSIKLSESISLSDSVSKTTNILLTESVLLTDVTAEEEEAGGEEGGEEREPEEVIELISFTDSITKEINKHLSESITLTDSYSNQVEILLSESVALTDAITDEKSVTLSLTESVSLTDSVGKDVTTALTESITLTDDMSKSQEVVLSESLVLSDTTPSIPINIIAMDAKNLLNPEYVELFTIDGKTYAIVTQPYEDKVTIYDISDPANIVVKDTETDGENGFNTLNEATGVDTFTIGSSTYAIVNSGSDSGVQIIDVSDPTNIVARDAEWDDDNGFTRLDSPLSGVETFTIGSSTYAIVTDKHLSNGGVQIIDVSDPTDIVARDAETDGENGFTELQGAYAADIFTIGSSTYAIVTAIGNWNSNGVQIIDVSDPANIVAKDAFTHANLAYPGGVETYTIDTSTYAIVTGYTTDTVQILDVSDPANIVAKDSLTNSGSLELDGAFEIDVFTIGSSTYAIITGYDDDGVQIIDVSDPANIVAKDSLTNSGSLELDGATDVETFVIGTKTYAIIVSVNTYQGNDGGVQILQLASDDEFAKKSANVSLSESITLTDAITDEATITLSESITLTDSVGKDVTTALTESITLTDDISVGKNVTTALTESITLTDNTSIGSATTASLSESIAFTDSILKEVDTNLTETVALDDSITIGKAVTQTLSETIRLTDVTTSDGAVKSTVEINDSTANGPNLANGDRFGRSVANIGDLNSDGVNDLAVGAYWDGGGQKGTVHIMFMNADGTVDSTVEINDSTINGPELANGFWFGTSVENIGDLDGNGVNDLAVGAILDSSGGDSRGATNIIFMDEEGDGAVKSTVEINDVTTNGPQLANNDRFGFSIANIGDLDGDGVNDLAVGAAYDDTESDGTKSSNPNWNAGAVHIMFMNTDGTVDSTVEINDSTANGPELSQSDYFGYSIENIGDLDGDGVNDLAVGAINDNAGGTDRGAIHIMFMNTDASVKSTVEINDSTTNGPELANEDRLGHSITNIGDLDGNGVNDLVVGAALDDTSGEDRGAVHIMFMNTDASVKSTVEINDSTINGPELSNNDQFGSSMTNMGDLDGNGVNDLAVGATLDDTGGENRGAIHIIYMSATKDGFSVSKEINISLSESVALGDSIGVGRAITKSLSESVSLTDSISNASEITLSESVLFADGTTLGKTVTQSLTESVSLDDSATKQVETRLTESVLLADSISTMKSKIISLSESVLLTDSHSKAIDAKLTESISLADTYSNQVDISLSESIALTDSISAGKSATITLTESIQVSDSVPTDPPNIVTRDYETDDANGFTLIENAHRVDTFTIGEKTYAIVTSPSDSGTDGVQVIDVSDPNNIVAKDTLAENNSLELGDAHGVDIFTIGEKTYAIVTAFFDDGVQVIDVSDPTNIVAKDVAQDDSDNPAYTELNGPKDVDVFTIGEKTYAIVASSRDSGVQVIDVSDPNNIVANGELNDTDVLELWNANAVETFTLTGTYAGTYAIVTAGRDDGVQIIDVSNPSPLQNNIVAKDLATDDVDGFTVLDGPTGVKTFTIASNSTATYAIVVTGGPEDGIQIIDVSNPTAIVALDAETDGNNGFNIMKDPSDVDVFTLGTSTYAIVTSTGDNGVTIIDISDPTDISVVDSLVDSGSLELADAKGVDTFKIHGNTYAIVTAAGDEDGVQIIELSTETGFTVNANYKIALTESILLTDGTTLGKTVTQSLSETVQLRDSKPSAPTNMLPISTVTAQSGNIATFTIDGGMYAISTTIGQGNSVDIIDLNDPKNLVVVDSETDTANGFTVLAGSRGVDTFTIGASTYAIVAAEDDGGVQIIDVSDPTDIVAKDTLIDTNSLALASTNDVDVFTIGASTYAIVTAVGNDDGVQIIDVSDPTDIVALDTLTDSDANTILDGPVGVDTFTVGASTYAIVASTHGTTGIQTIDISDPTNIVPLDSETDDVNGFDLLQFPKDVDVFTIGASTYAIVTFSGDGSGAVILDVTDPTNIVEKDGVQRNAEFPVFFVPHNADTFTIDSNTYAIVSARNDHGVQVIDISDTTNMVGADSAVNGVNGFTALQDAVHVETFTMGLTTYALVSSFTTGNLQLIQLSTDEKFVEKSINVSLSESIALTDSIAAGISVTQSLTESISLSDSAANTPEIVLAESVLLTDGTTLGKTITQSLSETIRLTDVTTSDGAAKSTVEINDSTANSPNLANGDSFGLSVANIGDLNSDGVNDLAVGAYLDGGGQKGTVHIMFMNADASVKSTVEINDSTANGPELSQSDYFGSSITNIGDLDGDGVNDLAVGAVLDDTNRGAIHIMFMNADASVKSTVEINDSTANGPELSQYDFFGSSMTNMGDLDGNGVNDLAVGAINDDAGGTDRGAIHIMFMNTDASVKSTVEINDSTANGPELANEDRLGYSITNIGDLDGDGVNDLAVGAAYDDTSGENRGAIHIMFMNTDASVKSTVEINDSTANGPELANEDRLGYSITNIGDLDGNGVNDLAVGAALDDTSGENRGAIHIMFMNADGTVDSTVEINDSTANGPELANEDRFGSSMTNMGDLDGNGVNDLAVGAINDDAGGTDRGAIHIIYMSATKDGFSVSKEINISLSESIALTDSIGAGISVTQSLTESISLSDSISNTPEIILSESVLFADGTTLGKAVTQSLTESISLDDSATKQVETKLDESISLSDSTSTMKSKIISLSESVLLTDSHSKTIDTKLTESVSLADTYSNQVDISLSESIALTDSIAAGMSVTQSLTESISLSDSISNTPEIVLSESVLFTDGTTIGKTVTQSLTETLQLQTASQYNDITAVRAQILGNQFGHHNGGSWASLVHLHSDKYALATYSTDGPYGVRITTFTISPDGQTITELDDMRHDTYTNGYNSIVKVDSDTVALAYKGSTGNHISTFDIDSDGDITKVDTLKHTTSGGSYNSLVQVDSDTYALAYENGGIYIATVDIDSDGNITAVKTESEGTLPYQASGQGYNSLVQVDSDTYALAYTGSDNDGYISTFTISSNGQTITKVDTLEHDERNGKWNSLVQVDSDTFALAYMGSYGGNISTFDIDSDGDITAVKTQSEGNNLNYNEPPQPAESWGKSFVKMDSDTFALAHDQASRGGQITTFNISSDGQAITKLSTLEHDTVYATRGTMLKVGSDTVAIAYNSGSGEYRGVISTVTIGTGTDLISINKNINTSLSESIALGDSISVGRAITQSLTETISFADSAANTPVINLRELVSFTEEAKLQYQPKPSESISFTDTVSIGRNPTAPTLAAAPGNNEVVLSWTKSVDPRVNTITDYVIQHSMDSGSTWVTINDGNNAINAYTVLPNYNGCPAGAAPCIANGDEAQFRVQGVNNLGGGQFSAPVEITPGISTANVPTVTVIQKPEKLTVEWITTNPTIVSDYLVYYGTSVLGPWTLYDDGLSTNTSTDVEGFTAFEPIFVKVQPISSETACPTEESQIRWAKPGETTPKQIKVLFAIPQENTVLLEWKAPKDGGSDIMEYQVRKRISADPSASPAQPAGPWQHYPGIEITSVRGGEVWHEIQVMGLPSDSRFDFQVRAKNMVGPNDEIGVNPGLGWSVSQTIQTQEVKMPDPDVYWGNDGIDNDHDGEIDERDEDRMGPPAFDANFDYDAAGTQYADDMKFDGTKDFGVGQTFGDNTEFVDGQEFDDDVNFTGEGIKFGGSKFKNPETFGVGAEFVGTQEFTGQNTFSANTKFRGDQDFGTNVQTFGAGTHFVGTADFAAGQEFAADTKFAPSQEFEHNEDYDFGGLGIDFGHNTNFGKARIFGASANFTAGIQTFVGQNTFAKGTEFAPGQTFSDAQVFGEGQKFADNMKFGDGQTFALDFDFEKEGLEFNDKTVFCQGEEIGAGAEFKGAVELGGATKFKGEAGKPIKFAAGQDFEDHIHDFMGEVEFMGAMDFRTGQDFEGDVEFKGLFDYDDMMGKNLEFKGDNVNFFMPPPVEIDGEIYVPPLAIPKGTVFGDGFDYDDMFSDEDGDGVNDEYYLFETGVKFAADTRFPPMIEFADGFSKNDMLGKTFTFDEGVFFAGEPVFPSGQKIKPGVMWDKPPTFEAGVDIDPGLALPANTKFSANLELPAFVAAPYGMVLEQITCGDEHCIPDESAYLAPGELLLPGIDPAPVVNFITGTNKTFANPGLGFEMAFDTVAKDGKVNVDLQDPLTVPGTTEGSTEGQRAMTSGSNIFQNIGSIIDVTVDSASTSGAMTVTLPYDESILGTTSEDEIVLLHYTNGQWVTVDNITVDQENNKVSGTVNSLSPFTVGKQTGTVSAGSSSTTSTSGAGAGAGAGGGGGGGGGGTGIGEGDKTGYPPLKIVELTYDTNENFVRIVLEPEYEKTDVIVRTATGFQNAVKIGTHPILNQAIYEAPLFIDNGPLQVSATAFVKSLVIEASPLIATVSAGTGTIKPEDDKPPVVIIPPSITPSPQEFQKPDDFITDVQCPFGTNLIDGKCVPQKLQEQPLPIQFAVILLLVLLAIGLVLAVETRRRKARKIVSPHLLFETEEDVIKPPIITKPVQPTATPPELEQEKSDLIELLETLQVQETIQKKLELLESQLLENVKEEAEIRERLTVLIKLVEIRVNLVEPLSLQQLKALPQPKRTYKKKRKVLTVEHKAKIAAARLGKKQTEITKQKIVLSKTGRKMSDEHKAKIAAARLGKKQTKETKQKIADSRTGKKMSALTKQKISKSKMTKKTKEEHLDET